MYGFFKGACCIFGFNGLLDTLKDFQECEANAPYRRLGEKVLLLSLMLNFSLGEKVV